MVFFVAWFRKWILWIVCFQVLVMMTLLLADVYSVVPAIAPKYFYKKYLKNESNLPEIFHLEDDTSSYFTKIAGCNISCFTAGTDWLRTATGPKEVCHCLNNYHGVDCGIPDVVWHSERVFQWDRLKVRQIPRRIVHAFNVNHEIEFFSIRMAEVGDVVDVFIVAESNWTAGGDPKPLYLLPLLQQGFQQSYHQKILHVVIDRFPDEGLFDGWAADTFIRDYMGQQGLKRIRGVRDDDLLVLLDADEIPSREVLLFLKLYDGYPQPVALVLRWSVFGYFWKRFEEGEEQVTNVVAAAPLKMIRELYANKIMSMRRHHVWEEPIAPHLSDSMYRFQRWDIGKVGFYSGHHCSWCYRPEGIRLKLMSAQKDDKPRWGDYPQKLELKYIKGLIENGEWFDGSRPFILVNSSSDRHFAPAYVLDNSQQFAYLLHTRK